MYKGLGVLALVVGGLWLLSKKAGAAIAPVGAEAIAAAAIIAEQASAMTAGQASAMLASPTDLISQNQAFIAEHPTAYSMIQQANTQIASGQASVGDVLRFQIDKAYYEKYVAEGGVASYEDFTLYSQYQTPEYKAAIEAAKDKELQYRVADIESSGMHYVEHMLETLTPGGWLYEGLAAKYPELAAKVEEPAPASVEQGTVPETFTASVAQLEALEQSGITQESEVYEAAVDYAYEAAAASCSEDEIVGWSSDGGYEAVSHYEYYE